MLNFLLDPVLCRVVCPNFGHPYLTLSFQIAAKTFKFCKLRSQGRISVVRAWYPTCLVKVMALTVGVVVSFMKAGLGGSIQPSSSRNNGWFPNGIIDSSTQKIAFRGLNVNKWDQISIENFSIISQCSKYKNKRFPKDFY